MFILLHKEQSLLGVIDVQGVSRVPNQIHKHEVTSMISQVQVLRVERFQADGQALPRSGRYRDVLRPAVGKATASDQPYLDLVI
jgi:hypothetical protein